jgi:hypothetical protein
MHTYAILITQRDGTQGRCYGLFSDAIACLLALLEEFPDAKRISARRAV